MRTPLHSLLASRGAVFRDSLGVELPERFGDPLSEYRAARDGLALADLSCRGEIAVTGEEGIGFLHRLLSCDVKSLRIGDSAPGCLLGATGKVFVPLLVVREEEAVILEVEPSLSKKLLDALEGYRFAERVEATDVSTAWGGIGLLGPGSPAALERLGLASLARLEPSRHGAGRALGGPVRVLRTDSLAIPSFTLYAKREALEPLFAALLDAVPAGRPIGTSALEMLRLEAGIPRYGVDFAESDYPQEAGLDDALSLTKGCYVGQEVVARLETYGGAKKRLVRLRFAGKDPAEAGDRIEREGREVGRVTSSAYSPALDRGIALGQVRKDCSAPGTEVAAMRGERRLAAAVEALSPRRDEPSRTG